MFEEYPDVVGVDALCKMLGIGKNTAYRLISDNTILSLRIGRSIKIPKKYIIDFCLNYGKKEQLCDNMIL